MISFMPSKERSLDRGTRKARTILTTYGEEMRLARTEHGLSQRSVAAAVGLSKTQVGRVERGEARALSIFHAARIAAVLGLDLSVRTYPGGAPIRDAAHRNLLDRFAAMLPSSAVWGYEVPLPIGGDDRAWDAVARLLRIRLGVEAETHVRDAQAVQRRFALKRRDDPTIDCGVLVLSDTRHHRALLREHGDALGATFPLTKDELLATLAAGRKPVADCLVLA
jgi:transcriptional regulator with XRE-family HTH domain